MKRPLGFVVMMALSLAALLTDAQAGPTSGALPAGYELYVDVVGVAGIPIDAEAVLLNVTAVSPYGVGYLTAYPCGSQFPSTSNLNYTTATVAVPNAVVAKVGVDGQVCIFTSEVTDVVVDISGYFPNGSSIEPLDVPARMLDTRDGTGTSRGVVGAGGTVSLQAGGVRGIPPDAAALIMNTTVVSPSAEGWITAYPCANTRPEASNINYQPQEIRPNLVLARLDQSGKTCLYTSQAAHLIGDVIAYFPGGSTGFVPIDNPNRILDTRLGIGASQAKVNPGSPLRLRVRGTPGVPADAAAVALNVTVTEPDGIGYTTVFPCGSQPGTSSLNNVGAQTVANLVVSGLDVNGDVCLASSVATHLLVDVAGYFSLGTTFVPVVPARIADTRKPIGVPRCREMVSQPAANRITVHNPLTGTRRQIVTTEVTGAYGLTMGPDCDSVLAFKTINNGSNPTIIQRFYFDRPPETIWQFPLGRKVPSSRIIVRNDGAILVQGQDLVDIASGRSLVMGSNAYRSAGVSSDGSVAAFASSLVGQPGIIYFDVDTNREIARFSLPASFSDPEMSPETDFLSFANATAVTNGVPLERPMILDLDGTILDIFPTEVVGPVRMSWWSSDTVILCVPGQHPVLWRIFNTPAPVPGGPFEGCPTA